MTSTGSEQRPTGALQLDERRVPLGDVTMRVYHRDSPTADRSLGQDEIFWLAGTATPAPRTASDLARAQELRIDERSLCETIRALTGVDKTFWPPGGWNGPPMLLTVAWLGDGLVRASYRAALDWDYYPAETKPADYAPHQFALEVTARVELAP